jgi:hypothetical protein
MGNELRAALRPCCLVMGTSGFAIRLVILAVAPHAMSIHFGSVRITVVGRNANESLVHRDGRSLGSTRCVVLIL